MDTGLLVLRLVVGGLFVGHGTQKLFGWFGGGGLDGTGAMYDSLGFRPGRRLAVVAGVAEAGGGVLLALGLLTPLGAAMIIGVMFAAILAVHVQKGVWNQNGGLEFPLVMATAALTVAMVGPGAISFDESLNLANGGVAEGLGALVLGAGVASLLELRRRAALEEDEQAEGPPGDGRRAA
ncbi:MAG: DoxX family protein [Actinomycetota bacterium]